MAPSEVNLQTMSPKDLLERGVVYQRYEELTCFDRIEIEQDLVDHHRIDILKKSMQGQRGQIDPVTLRARLVRGKVLYDIINGYHRTPARIGINKDTGKNTPLKATVLYGCSDEEMYDLRVIAADNVKSIKFPRMARWMTASFKSRKWEHRRIASLIKSEDLTLSQVFSLASQDSSGIILRLTPDETQEVKEWALNKAEIWGRPIGTLAQDMRTVDLAAPDLVQRVRLGTGAHGERGVLTQARLQSIAEGLPGEWELQRKFVELAIKHNVVAKDLGDLVFAYTAYLGAGDKKSAEQLLINPDAFLHPKPRPDIAASETIFDASTMTINKDRPLPVPRESGNHRLNLPANRYQASFAISRLLLAMFEKQAFAIPLSVGGKETVTFNFVTPSITNRKTEVPLTTEESRMLLIVFAIKNLTRKRITGKGLSTWFFSTETQHVDSWQSVFDSLKTKLTVISPALADNLCLTERDSITWIDKKK